MLGPAESCSLAQVWGRGGGGLGSVPTGDRESGEANRASQYLQTWGSGTLSPKKDLILPGDPVHIPLPHNRPLTQLTGLPREQGQGVPAWHRDGSGTSGASTVPGVLCLSGGCGEPLSSLGLRAGGP